MLIKWVSGCCRHEQHLPVCLSMCTYLYVYACVIVYIIKLYQSINQSKFR